MSRWKDILIEVLDSADAEDYSGYSKFDALNSPYLKALSLGNKWVRFLFIQLVKECPFHIRPLLGVKRSRNPKGIALFARAYLTLYERTGAPEYLQKGESLIQWLLNHPSPGFKRLCWGYNYIWQSTIFLQDQFEPNLVVSAFAGEALIQAYRITGKGRYLEAACSVAGFMTEDLPVLFESDTERAISYVPTKGDVVVLNIQVLTGAFLAKVWKETGEEEFLEKARRHLNYTVNRRTKDYAWYYTHPREKSLIHHDNYHTGGILDGLLEYYEESGDGAYSDIYWNGLDYYQINLFEPDGAPRWMNDKRYPYDIHGAAQGIISFKKAGRHKGQYQSQAEKVATWTIGNLYRGKTRDFAYRKGRWMKWNYSLMRWCNAWMARALAELI